jgi:hypothetical protein
MHPGRNQTLVQEVKIKKNYGINFFFENIHNYNYKGISINFSGEGTADKFCFSCDLYFSFTLRDLRSIIHQS